MTYVPDPADANHTAAYPRYPDVAAGATHSHVHHHGSHDANPNGPAATSETLSGSTTANGSTDSHAASHQFPTPPTGEKATHNHAEKGQAYNSEVDSAALARQKTIPNEVNFGFVMTMLGFSITFVVAEVIPLFYITLFTVIAYDLAQGAHVIWGLVSQIIAIGAIVPFVGTLADLLGRKGVTLVSLGLTIIGMIVNGTTPNLAGFFAGQAISGLGIGIQLLTAIAAVTELVPTHKRGITIGYIVCGFLPFAPASVYGQLLATHSWRYVSVVVGFFAVLAFIILLIWYKPPPRQNTLGLTKRQIIGRIDFVGSILSISGVTIFLIGLNWGGQDFPWSSAHVIATLTVGLALLVILFIWEIFFAPYPLFPAALIGDKTIFWAVCFLCLTSGINYIPVVVFWVVQCYSVYMDGFKEAGIHLLPIGFCIAGGAIISAAAMSVFKHHIHWVLLFFCVIQTAGLGSMAAIDPDNINTAWAPMVFGLVGVGGVLLPSQVVFSIISPEELIGTSVALSIVIRSIGQVIGISMFYNIFSSTSTENATNDLQIFALPAIGSGLVVFNNGQLDLVATQERIRELLLAATAGPLSKYIPEYFPEVNTPEKIAFLQQAASNLYRMSFPKMYLVSIAWGGAACISCFFLRNVKKFMNEDVAVRLH